MLRKLMLILVLYSVCRLLFFLSNWELFKFLDSESWIVLLGGLRFDVAAICMTNAPFILLSFVPRLSERILKFVYVLMNSSFITVNIADAWYYRFTFQRMTIESLKMSLFELKNQALLFSLVKQYAFVIAMIAVVIGLLSRFYGVDRPHVSWPERLIYVIISTVLTVIGWRGGLQPIPMMIVNARQYNSSAYPVVLNSSFTLLHSTVKRSVERKNYMSSEQALKLVDPIHEASSRPFKPMNVVVIILESFADEYCDYHPFLNSLKKKSLSFELAISNGKRSIDGVPAVLGGIPKLMPDSYVRSVYATNQIDGLGTLLKPFGYFSAFFHGATNGSMSFDAFFNSGVTGFEKYFGRSEYRNERDFDGTWGIWDEEFFQFAANQISVMNEPFLVGLFSVSSHGPYQIPNRYKSMFKPGTLEIHQAVRYTDYALKRFFETASKQSWYMNTLFVITADHTGLLHDNRPIPEHHIPMLFFAPSDPSLVGTSSKVVQQTDVVPSILDYIGYPKRYYALGKSVFQELQGRFAVFYTDSDYWALDERWLIRFDGEHTTGVWDYLKDPDLKNDQSSMVNLKLENQLKALIQVYNDGLIENRMHS